MVYHDRVYIIIQLMYNKNDHLAKQSIFVRCLMSSLASITPFPPKPKTPFTYVVYVYSDMSFSKGHLGSRGVGEASKNKLKDTSFAFPVTNITILSIFGTHEQEGYCKVLEMNSTSILYILALLLFEN